MSSPDAAFDGHSSVHALQCMEIWGGNRAIDTAASTPGLDLWVYSRPHEGQSDGGDVHYVSMCSAGKIARLAVADVSGHGASVADLGAKLRDLMRAHINTVDQTKFARSLNRHFTAAAEHGGGAGKFATAILATYFSPEKALIVVNAGHPRPFWYHAGAGRWTVLDSGGDGTASSLGGLPLGIIEPTEYAQFAVKLGVGDLVLIYTDSLPEARRGGEPGGALLGEDGLLGMLSTLDPSDPSRLIHALLDEVRRFAGGRMPDDDATVVLLHHNGADPPRYTLGEKLSAIGKMMGIGKV